MATFVDNFNRANTPQGDLGPNWNVAPWATLQISGQRVIGQGPAQYSAGQTDTVNQVVSGLFRINQHPVLAEQHGVVLRGSPFDDGYICGFILVGGDVTFTIWKKVSGVLTQLAQAVNPVYIPVGYDVRVHAIVEGTGIRIVDLNTQTDLVSTTDSDLAGPGYCGFDLGVDGNNNSVSFDNFYMADAFGPEPPLRPTVTTSNITTTGVCLRGSDFYDRNYDSHESTQYQITLESEPDFSNPTVDVTIVTGQTPDDEGLTYYCFTGLTSGTQYKARIRYEDSSGEWSDWSPIVHFTTLPENLPVSRTIFRCEKHEISCEDTPEDVWQYTLRIYDDIEQVCVTEIVTPDGAQMCFNDCIPFCVIADIYDHMLAIKAEWGTSFTDCRVGRLEVVFDATTPKPITVTHNCGKIPVVQVFSTDAGSGYDLIDEIDTPFTGEPPAQGVWVRHVDENEFQVYTTATAGIIIAIFR